LVNFEIVFNFEKFERVEVVKFKPVDALCAPELHRYVVRAEHRHPWCASITTGEATQLLYPGVSHVCGPGSREPLALSLVHTMLRHMDAVA
jgi:hypothetical protein